MATDQQASACKDIDPYKFLHIILNPDGTLTRLDPRPTVPSTQPINETPLGFFKDVPLNEAVGTSLRLFLPLNQTPANKLPVIVFFHGGGFILQSADGKTFHDICQSMAAQFPAVVVSVDYRLAPENRLPAAYLDASDAIMWVSQQALGDNGDPWIREYADTCRCFLVGGSSGANIAYNTRLQLLDQDIEPVKIVGLVLSTPFLGGVKRTESEIRLTNDAVLPLAVADLMWELALPVGADRDHEYSNLVLHGVHNRNIRRLPSCLVRAYSGDPLIDRQRHLVLMLKAHGVQVTPMFHDGGVHAAEVFLPITVQDFLDDVKCFISAVGSEGGGHRVGQLTNHEDEVLHHHNAAEGY